MSLVVSLLYLPMHRVLDLVQSMLEVAILRQHKPYASPEGEEGEDGLLPRETDSTKVRIIKPLESYFFNDSIRALPNFKWHLRSGYNEITIMPIDTM